MRKSNLLPIALVLLIAACDDAQAPALLAAPCIANASVACACPGGAAGAQTCLADGTFSACVCPCQPGFAFGAAGCVDIDECATGLNTCHPDATCANLDGDYLCRCDGFFLGTGEHCDLDECRAGTDTCHPLATCTNLDPGYACSCPAGYRGDGTACTDIDECGEALHDCAVGADCTDLPGSFTCACREGFRLGGGACVNIDECSEGLDTCGAAAGVACRDASPGFACVCAEGYRGDGVTCTPDAASMVRDLAERPVTLTIAGLGSFSVAGLSRVGWDLEVIETPTTGGRTHKDPGLVAIPDITLRSLTGTSTAIAALVAWAQQGPAATPREASLLLMGLGGESAVVTLLDARPQAALTASTPDGTNLTMAELVLRLPNPNLRRSLPMVVTEWTPPHPGYAQCAAPGQALEIQGAAVTPCYPLGVLDVPAPTSSESLYLPAVRGNEVVAAWARTLVDNWLANPTAGIDRKDVSIIDRNTAGAETSRINTYENFPARFDFFDPTHSYGHEYLFDLLLVCDRAEQA